MAQRRPHGQNANQITDSAASWRAEALEADHLSDTQINKRRELEEAIGEGLYSTRPNPVKRRRPSDEDPMAELKQRSAERIRLEQERRVREEEEKEKELRRAALEKRREEAQREAREKARIEEEQAKVLEARAQRRKVLEAKALREEKSPEQMQFRRRRSSSDEQANKPRKMSEDDLQDILRQIRKERGLEEQYEAELARRREEELKRQRAEELARQREEAFERRREELERRRAEDIERQRRIHEEARRRREERRRLEALEESRQRVRTAEPEEEYEAEFDEEYEETPPVKKSAAKEQKTKKEKKVFTRSFKKGFFIAWGAFVLILIAAMVLLWTFLNRYESGLPEHYMNEIVEDIQNGELEALHLVTADEIDLKDPSLFAAEETVSQYLKDKNEENKLRYVKVNAESTSDENVYLIRSGDENLLKVYLDRDKNGSKKEQWSEVKTQLVSDQLKVTELVAQIPTSCTLVINQQAVDRSFITEAGSRIQLLSRLIDEGIVHDMPTVDTYTVRGIFAGTDVSMTDENGNVMPCQLIGEVYTAGFEADEAFVAEQIERVRSLFDPYARYFSGDAGREALSRVMLDNSPAFVSASSADVSWMQEHDGIELSEESVTNIKKYSDDCYSCDISFVQDIMRDGESVRTWDTNMTWIMVRDGDYYLADIITKTADD